MEIINVIMADPNEEYIHYFTKYVRNSEQARALVIQAFTDLSKFQDKLESLLEQPNEFQLLLIHSDWISVLSSISHSMCTVILSDAEAYEESEENQDINNLVFKYQPLDQIFASIMLVYSQREIRSGRNVKFTGFNKTKVISIFSSSGGGGKTTVAVNLIKQLAGCKKKVFYLNLESLSSASMFVEIADKDEFAKLLYYIQTKPSELKKRLEQFIRYESSLQCYYIIPPVNYQDAIDITMHDIQCLIQTIVDTGQYDAMVIDLESSLHERIQAAMDHSQHIIWLLTDDTTCLIKTRFIRRELKKKLIMEAERQKESDEKCHFILNKFTGTVLNNFEKEGIRIQGQLPYISQWKSICDRGPILSSDVFNKHITLLSNHISGIREEVNQ